MATKEKTSKAKSEKASEKKEAKPKRRQLLLGDPQASQTNPDVVDTPVPEEGKGKPGSGAKYVEKQMLLVGTWVVLADTKNVPEELVGHHAYITYTQMKTSDGDEQIPVRHQYQDEDTTYTVKTRDEYSATLEGLKREDFKTISTNGRVGLGHAG